MLNCTCVSCFFHQQLSLHTSVTGDHVSTENYRRAAIYSRVVLFFFWSAFTGKYFAGSCPPEGLNWLWEDCPLLAAIGHCRTGFVLEFWWSWIVSDYRVCTVNVTCDYCHMSPGTAHSWQQSSCVPLNEASQDKTSTPPELADVPSVARSQSFWFPRWVDPDILDVSSQFWCWLCH